MAILFGISRICYGNYPALKVGFKVKKSREKLLELGRPARNWLPSAFW
jgi:hypothetical protein